MIVGIIVMIKILKGIKTTLLFCIGYINFILILMYMIIKKLILVHMIVTKLILAHRIVTKLILTYMIRESPKKKYQTSDGV